MLLSHFPGPNGLNGTDRTKTFPNACEAYKAMFLQIPYFYPAADVSPSFLDDYDSTQADLYHNSILLVPRSYSLPSPDEDFWEFLTEALCEKGGYDVYTNVSPAEKEVKGTLRLEKSIRETFNLSRYFRAVISTRCGFSDHLAFQPDARHIVLSPEERLMEFNDIAAYGKSDQIVNIDFGMMEKYTYNTLIRMIMDEIP